MSRRHRTHILVISFPFSFFRFFFFLRRRRMPVSDFVSVSSDSRALSTRRGSRSTHLMRLPRGQYESDSYNGGSNY